MRNPPCPRVHCWGASRWRRVSDPGWPGGPDSRLWTRCCPLAPDPRWGTPLEPPWRAGPTSPGALTKIKQLNNSCTLNSLNASSGKKCLHSEVALYLHLGAPESLSHHLKSTSLTNHSIVPLLHFLNLRFRWTSALSDFQGFCYQTAASFQFSSVAKPGCYRNLMRIPRQGTSILRFEERNVAMKTCEKLGLMLIIWHGACHLARIRCHCQ